MDKTMEHLKETLEDEIKKIVKKNDITPQELDNVKDAIYIIDMIDNMGMGGYSERRNSYGYSERMPYNQMMYGGSYDDFPSHAYRRSHNESYNGYHGDSYRNYHDGSYRRGRSPVTGRYISMDAGYSGHSIVDRMVAKLESMYDEAKTEHEKQMVDEWINRLQAGN